MVIIFALAINLVFVENILVMKVIVTFVDSVIIIHHLMLKELSRNQLNYLILYLKFLMRQSCVMS